MLFDPSNLKALRTSLGLSQQELARRAGVSQSMIAKVEAGRLDPSLSNARRIEKALAEQSPKGVMVSQVMSRHVLSFPSDTPVLEAIKAMRKKGISQFPVIDGELVVGRVTESSILDGVERLVGATVAAVMLPPPPMVDEGTPVNAVLPLLQVYSSVLVLKEGRVVGIVTKADAMMAALRQKA